MNSGVDGCTKTQNHQKKNSDNRKKITIYWKPKEYYNWNIS